MSAFGHPVHAPMVVDEVWATCTRETATVDTGSKAAPNRSIAVSAQRVPPAIEAKLVIFILRKNTFPMVRREQETCQTKKGLDFRRF